MNHTPTPLTAAHVPLDGDMMGIYAFGTKEGRKCIAKILPTKDNELIAEEIVGAVNSYEALVEALKECIFELEVMRRRQFGNDIKSPTQFHAGEALKLAGESK